MPTTQTTREKLEAKKRQVEEQLKRLNAREAKRKRQDDTRRKIIAGALALTHAQDEQNEEFRRTLYRLIGRYTTRPGDRALFGLDPLESENDGRRGNDIRSGADRSGACAARTGPEDRHGR